MIIDIRSETSLYIEINKHVFYIDDSTNEQIMNCWLKDETQAAANDQNLQTDIHYARKTK
tara:strand:+ start:268 stop:447 length:180 start_codon:yes stop_codon:yes gene_type:complete